jgi:signal transduction histidine kinase
MLNELLSKFRQAFRRGGGRPDFVSVLLPFLIIGVALGALAWRSYMLSVKMEHGATTIAEQYAGYAAEITARRVDAAVRAEMTLASEEWQQMERQLGDPTTAGLRDWVAKHEWIVAAMYLPDYDPDSSLFVGEPSANAKGQLRLEREFYTSTGTVGYTYDPHLLLAAVKDAVRRPPLVQNESSAPLTIQQQADISLVYKPVEGVEKLDDGFSFVSSLAAPLSSFGVRAVVRTVYVGGKGWQNQRVMSLWVSLLALVLTGIGALLAFRGRRKEAETMSLRGALIANVSHELRTPLSMIRLGAETLKLGRLKEKERKDIEEQILREVLLLSHLVENVLDVARMQNHSERALAFTPVGPRELIRSLIATYESWIGSRGFTVSLDLDETVAEQMWDRDAVSRALLNLIDNAIKYSGEEKKAIEVVLRQTAEHVILEVKDHGIGIGAEDVARIFDPYFRAQFSDTITRRGAGLGLTLVQQIVSSHGGRTEVESTVGEGSTFRLLFPRTSEMAAPLAAIQQPREAF